MACIQDLITYLEQVAPLAYQEDYDQVGLVVGEESAPVTGVLICLDITEAVLQEAQLKNCNLIIAHHPIIFKPLKQLTGKNHVERCILYAIQHNLAIYTLHTNLDNIAQGVNRQIAQTLGLQNLSILLPKPDTLHQLITFAPKSSLDHVLQALHAAGAGCIGNYTHCSFVTTGRGAFKPIASATPYLGTPNQLAQVEEERIEVIFPAHNKDKVLHALKTVHPYEEVAYYLHRLENTDPTVGAGMLGALPQALRSEEFLHQLKIKMQLPCIRHTTPLSWPVRRIAICGGAGSTLLPTAILKQADVLVTADVKYHDFFNTEKKILLADIGHYESEVSTKTLIHTLLSKKFANIALVECVTVTNPIHYYF